MIMLEPQKPDQKDGSSLKSGTTEQTTEKGGKKSSTDSTQTKQK
jgi:hypothetical protein